MVQKDAVFFIMLRKKPKDEIHFGAANNQLKHAKTSVWPNGAGKPDSLIWQLEIREEFSQNLDKLTAACSSLNYAISSTGRSDFKGNNM